MKLSRYLRYINILNDLKGCRGAWYVIKRKRINERIKDYELRFGKSTLKLYLQLRSDKKNFESMIANAQTQEEKNFYKKSLKNVNRNLSSLHENMFFVSIQANY